MSHLLFEPLTLRGVTFRNRIWVPPMCQYSAEHQDGTATPWHVVHYGGLARGGAGAIIVEATGVTPEARISAQDLGLWNDEQRDALIPVVDFMHSQGAAAGIQLAHAGRKASTYPEWGTEHEGSLPEGEGGWRTVAPSAQAFPGLEAPRELTEAEIAEIVAAFAASTRRSIQAGFDFVEIHAAHGYLLHEFLSPLSNTRTDAYGGTLENRSRFLLEVVDATRAEVGESVPVLVRLSATDWTDDGLSLSETAELSVWLKAHGVDLVDVSTGGNVLAQIPVGPGYQTNFSAGIRERADIPTAAVGLITEPFQAEHILATGQADVVLLGRESLRDPNFAIRAAAALRHEIDYTPAQYQRAYK
ncbi:NADH:flavin oxidoreductase/NADH oxidase [Brevibacterium sp. GP-SGM9]|uniref:NADH:flavin oxidoreductase/NADH oxidase n=1 Tax=unclassified Brevibacterium TaxID=2614124 RepID=UPI001E3F8988|nr:MULTISPECIES: NADH:flavin oxidoreductase/NADH oxidase [unclassified Brevibacterium]MCD1287532.1 oxidoreductase [Brevibacterium sp. CCUG 69071]MDK8436660.1 NADH:flavin oxidoreductase/NADH oxidase [Brevibacterium sp. H-BE7]